METDAPPLSQEGGQKEAFRSTKPFFAVAFLLCRPPFSFDLNINDNLSLPNNSTTTQVEQLDADGLEAAIASRDRPLIIDFFATWCGPCVLMAKELETVAAELGDKVKIVKIDVDANEAIASSLSIQGLPTLVFVGTEPGKPALRTEGLLPAATIKEIIANEL